MNKQLKDGIRKAAIAFVGGVLLALAAPYIAPHIGVTLASLGNAARPLWLGSFMAIGSVISSSVTPLVGKLLCDKHLDTVTDYAAYVPQQAKQLGVAVQQQMTAGQECASCGEHKHRDLLAEQAVRASSEQSTQPPSRLR